MTIYENMDLFLDLFKNTLLCYIVYRLVTRCNQQQTQLRKMKSQINTCIENIETLEQNIIKVRDVLDATRETLLTVETERHLKNINKYSL